MQITASKLFLVVALVCFLVAFILVAASATLGFAPIGWIALGLASWVVALLV